MDIKSSCDRPLLTTCWDQATTSRIKMSDRMSFTNSSNSVTQFTLPWLLWYLHFIFRINGPVTCQIKYFQMIKYLFWKRKQGRPMLLVLNFQNGHKRFKQLQSILYFQKGIIFQKLEIFQKS